MREGRVSQAGFIDVVVWSLPRPPGGPAHSLKVRLACVVDGDCVQRYDNEAGMGDHQHASAQEMPCAFVPVDRLLDVFWADVAAWKRN